MKNATLLPLLLPFLFGCSASGPSAQTWEQTGGPYARDISALLPDNRLAGTIYASLGAGEIVVSTTGGRSWESATSIPGDGEVHQLVQDPENPNRLIAATGEGAFVSQDRARTWTRLSVGPAGTGVRAVAIDPWSTSVIFAGTEGRGFYKSSDAGETWSAIDSSAGLQLSGAEVFDIGIDLSKPDLIFAAVAPYGVVCSTDAGVTWHGLTPEFSALGSRVTCLLIRKGGNGTLLYGTNSGTIMKTTNGGNSWSPSRTGKEFDAVLSLCAFPGNPDRVFAGTGRGFIVSTDFGTVWTPGRGDLPSLPTRVVVSGASPQVTVFAHGNGMGVRASEDNGETWRRADMKLGGSTVGILATTPSGDRLFAAAGNVCMSYTAGGSGEWSDAGPGITGGVLSWVSVDPYEPGRVYATTPAGAFVSTDNGGGWQSTPRSMQISPFLFEAHPTIHTRMFMASDQGIFLSTDRGRTWGQTRPLGNRWMIHSLTFSPTNAGTIIGATSNSGVIISYDGGLTWEQARYGIPGDRVELVTIDDADPETYYAYLPDGNCFRSRNKGLEWNRYAPPWKSPHSFRIASDPREPNSVVALVDNRFVYFSRSGGGTWFRAADTDLHAEVVSLCWNAATMTLYAGARERGVFRLRIGNRVRDLLGE